LVKLAAVAIVVTVASAHTPYGQWTVYRQRNLFIVASRTDTEALNLAQALAASLARELPESHARMTRAADPVRVASLLATGQLDVAIVSRDEAASMLVGSGAYRAVGPVPLRALAELGGHVLVTVESFKARHAYLLAEAVEHLRASLPVAAATASLQPIQLPVHPGAATYYIGAPVPKATDHGARDDKAESR
jgi:TRAP-type uncharacterized transport system substrate-binding protein